MLENSMRIAILDLYDGEPNQGMRCIREILHDFASENAIHIEVQEFDVRVKSEVPDLSFDAYISTGGPGSPIDSEGSEWEAAYFGFMDELRLYNRHHTDHKKYVFLICHSFQLYCRYYGLGKVSKRLSTSFGVMPIHMTSGGTREPYYKGLMDPFWAVDSRDWQVTEPDMKKIHADGGDVLSIEKYRPHVKLERCVMAMRFDDAIFGTQFHPEADSSGMLVHLLTDDKKQNVIHHHGEAKYHSMIEHLNDPDKIVFTHDTILPNFLKRAVSASKELITK
jgi:GMP synthase-like glutamine amidotransferase